MEISTLASNNEKYDSTTPISDMEGCTVSEWSRAPADRAGGGEAPGERFRVSVSLARYFSDERSRAYVSVSRRLPVRWLRRRLRTLFGLRGPFYLCSRGHLLPSDEPLSLLQPDDPVEVIPMSERTLDWDENGFMYNMKETSPEIQSNLPQKKSTELETAKFTQEADEELLLRMKEKALAILDTCDGVTSIAQLSSEPVICATSESDKPRRLRRRVRRRKRRFSGEKSNEENIQEKDAIVSNNDEGEVMQTRLFTASIQNCEKLPSHKLKSPTEGAVILETIKNKNTVERNMSSGPRRARLIHSLSPSYGQTSLTNAD